MAQQTKNGKFKVGDIVTWGSDVPCVIKTIDSAEESMLGYECVRIEGPNGTYGAIRPEELGVPNMKVVAEKYAYLLHYMQR